MCKNLTSTSHSENSSAHKNISDAIDAARRASIEAKERVWEAQRRLYPDDGSSVIERAEVSLNKSKELQREALAEMEHTNGEYALHYVKTKFWTSKKIYDL